jgi:uncharacterized membrane protein HdeD (DUF308 family)
MSQELQGVSAQIQERIREHAGVAITVGVVILIMGIMALGSPMVAGISVALMVGIVMIISGIAQFVFAFKAGQGFWPYVLAVLSIVAGGYMAGNPAVAAATLTIFLAAYLLATGISEILLAFQMKPVRGWGWTLFSGVLSVLLGVMIWGQFPLSGVMAIGILLGFKLLFSGMTLITLGMAARKAV